MNISDSTPEATANKQNLKLGGGGAGRGVVSQSPNYYKVHISTSTGWFTS